MKNGKSRKPRRLPEILTEEEQTRILAILNADKSLGRLRNLALVRVFLNTGIRAAELIGLQVRDINWTNGDFLVHGKGGKDRMLALNDADLALLKSYLGSSVLSSGNRPVFTSLDGQRPLNGRVLRRWIKRLGEKAGITHRVYCHGFRHTLAVDLLRATNSLKTVQDCLGHENIGTTTIYARLVNGEVKNALRELRGGGTL